LVDRTWTIHYTRWAVHATRHTHRHTHIRVIYTQTLPQQLTSQPPSNDDVQNENKTLWDGQTKCVSARSCVWEYTTTVRSRDGREDMGPRQCARMYSWRVNYATVWSEYRGSISIIIINCTCIIIYIRISTPMLQDTIFGFRRRRAASRFCG